MNKDTKGEGIYADDLDFADENPNFVNHFLRGSEEDRHYKFLYLHVLAQVASDLQCGEPGQKQAAERYLKSPDYQKICEYLFGAGSKTEFEFIAQKLRTCDPRTAKNVKRYTFSIQDGKTKGHHRRKSTIAEIE